MSLVLLVTALGLLAFPALARPVGRHLAPAEWSRLTAASLVTGVVTLEAALILLGLPAVLRAVGVSELAATCRRLLGELAPGGISIGWSATVLAVVFPTALLRGWRLAARGTASMRIEPLLGEHSPRGGIELVVLPTVAPVAYSVAGAPDQVVVSLGLAVTLPPALLDAVIRHETAHLRRRHQSYLLGISALERALPIARLSTNSVRVTLERCADEDAAASSPAARAAVRDALLQVATVMASEPAVAAFTSLATLLDRVDALAAPSPAPSRARRLATYVPASVIGLLAAGAIAGWAYEAHMMLAMVGACNM